MSFEAIGTGWQIDTPEPLAAATLDAVSARIETFDRTWSRFRDDSLVSRIAATPGRWEFGDDAPELFDLYRRLYEATNGAMSPLVGRSLETLGYDRAYSLRPSGAAIAAPSWDAAVAWDGTALDTIRPVVLDVGAAGKGHLVDIVAAVLAEHGVREVTIDASGDILHVNPAPIRVALEHPGDPTSAIGVVSLGGPGARAIAASATNRRTWGNGLHHVLNATTGLPTTRIIATWVIAETALLADGLATALFFSDPADLAQEFDFQYVRMHSGNRVERSPDLDGELFT